MLEVSAPDAAPTRSETPTGRVVRLLNKADLVRRVEDEGANIRRVSARTGYGVTALRACLSEQARALTAIGGPPPLTRARHRAALTNAIVHLQQASQEVLPELRAENLRLALTSLGRVTGEVGVEDLLDTIFREFCIGK